MIAMNSVYFLLMEDDRMIPLRLGEILFSPLQELRFLFSNGEANYSCSCLYLVRPSEEIVRQLHPTAEVRYRAAARCASSCLCVCACTCV